MLFEILCRFLKTVNNGVFLQHIMIYKQINFILIIENARYFIHKYCMFRI